MPTSHAPIRAPSCAHCNDGPAESEFVRASDGALLCRSCADGYWPVFVRCFDCDQYEHRSYAVTAVDDPRCRYFCADCRNSRLWGGRLHCCDSCEEYFLHGLHSDDLCESCYDDRWNDDDDPDQCDLINSYGYAPTPRFHGDGPVFLGLELEVTTPSGELREAAQVAIDTIGDLGYLKSDSSVSGFELVTHPMSHAWMAEHFPWKTLDELARMGCDGYENGIHVHVSRAGFDSPAHIFRWLKLIYRNEDPVTAIARRESEWASFSSRARQNAKHHAKGSRQGDRYCAVNVQNFATFEVRVFRSSLDRQEVRAALDLVSASVEYTRHLTVPAILSGGWTWQGFMEWARERPEYAALVAESEARVCAC